MNAKYVNMLKKHLLAWALCLTFAGTAYSQSTNNSNDRDFRFWMSSRFNFDAAHYFNLKNGLIVDETPTMVGGVSLRQLRVAVHAELNKDWYSEIMVDLANGMPVVRNAFVRYSGLEDFEFRMGNFKEDFSMEETTSWRNRLFVERPMVVSCFAPARHVGIQAQWQKYDFLYASVGTSWFRVSSSGDYQKVLELRDQGKPIGTNFTGKIVWSPWVSSGVHGLHVGYNASYRSAKRAGNYNGSSFQARNSTSVNHTNFLSTEFYGVKYDLLQGFELAGYRDGFRAGGEFIISNSVMDKGFAEATANPNTKKFHGYYAQASYLLFGGKQRYNRDFVQPTRGKIWGDIEVMARYEYLNLNSEDIHGGSGRNIAFGVVYHMNNHVKMMLNYQISHNDKYANNNGRVAIGRDSQGNYTTDWNAAVRDFGVGFNVVQARIEIAF